MSRTDEVLLEVAREQLCWIRASAMAQVRETDDVALDTAQKRRSYELCDGETTTTAIAPR